MIKPISSSVSASVAATGFMADHAGHASAAPVRWKRPAMPDLLSFISPSFARVMAFAMIAPAYLLAFALLLGVVVFGLPGNGFIQSQLFTATKPAVQSTQAVPAPAGRSTSAGATLVASADSRIGGTKTVALVVKLP